MDFDRLINCSNVSTTNFNIYKLQSVMLCVIIGDVQRERERDKRENVLSVYEIRLNKT